MLVHGQAKGAGACVQHHLEQQAEEERQGWLSCVQSAIVSRRVQNIG